MGINGQDDDTGQGGGGPDTSMDGGPTAQGLGAVAPQAAQQMAPPPPQPSAAQKATAKHGGLLTGLVGVLLDGLSAGIQTPESGNGMAQAAQLAAKMPQQRAQQRMTAETAEQQHQIQMAQMHIQLQQIKHMASNMNDSQLENLTDFQKDMLDRAMKSGQADVLAEGGRDEIAAKVAELQKQKPDALNYLPLIVEHDKDGNVIWGAVRIADKDVLTEDENYTLPGIPEYGLPDQNIKIPAGARRGDAFKMLVDQTRAYVKVIDAKTAEAKQQTAKDIQGPLSKSETAIAVQKLKNAKPPAPGATDKRADESYKLQQGRLDKLRKPVDDAVARLGRLQDTLNQNSPQADALVAPELLTVMAGGAGSGLRMNEAEISRVIGGRSKWEALQAAVNKWSIDPATATSITPEQRKEIRALTQVVQNKLTAKQKIVQDSQNSLINSKDVDEHRKIVTDMQSQLDSIDSGKFPDRDTANNVRRVIDFTK